MIQYNRRDFMRTAAFGAAAFSLLPSCISRTDVKTASNVSGGEQRYKISLAQWSLHRTLNAKKLDHLDFAMKAASFGIFGIEYVNQFFKDKATDSTYLEEMNQRARDHEVTQLLIMIDGEGPLAETDQKKRNEAVRNHYKWVDAAKILGCHSIRVNAQGNSQDREGTKQAAVQGLGDLSEYAFPMGINVIVENHGGLSSDGQWLSSVISEVNMENCGTLPDFGNFCIRRGNVAQGEEGCLDEYDKYKGVEELLPYARAVSAKSYDFDEKGNETTIDFSKMIELVKQSNYSGYLGIEYEGSRLSEDEGIMATKKLLEKLI